MTNRLRFSIAAFVFVVFSCIALRVPSAKAADGVLLTGSAKSDVGAPMAGITVSAKAEGSTITTTVYTDADGNFYFPRLPEGHYRVTVQAKGYDAARSAVQLSGQSNGAVQHQNFTLKTVEDFSRQLSGDEWLASLPEDTKEDRRMKEVLRLNCVGCHSPAYPLQNRFDEKGWEAILTLMSKKVAEGGCYYTDCTPGGTGDDQPRMAIVSYFKTELATYLAKVRGPEAYPTKLHARQRPEGEAAMAVITEYDVPLMDGNYPVENGSDWSFGTPGKAGGVHDAQIGWDGNIYFTNWSPTMVRTVGKLDMKTGKITDIKVPAARGFVASSHAIVRDQNGVMWFNVRDNSAPNIFNSKVGEGVNTGRLARLDPKTGKVDIYTPPADMVAAGSFVDWDGKGNIWMAGAGGSGLLHFDATTHKFTETKATQGSENGDIGLFYGVAGDKDGNGWGSQISADMEGRVDAETGKMLEVKLPRRTEKEKDLFTDTERKVFAMQGQNEFYWGAPWGQGPRRPGGDKNGDFVWVPGWWSHTLLKIDIHTAKVVGEYPMPTRDAGPYMAQVDKDHMVWVNYQNAGTITKFDPKTEKWTEYSLPSLGVETHQIGVFDHDGPTQIVVADERNSKIDRVQFRTQSDMTAAKTEASQRQSASK